MEEHIAITDFDMADKEKTLNIRLCIQTTQLWRDVDEYILCKLYISLVNFGGILHVHPRVLLEKNLPLQPLLSFSQIIYRKSYFFKTWISCSFFLVDAF